MSAGRSGSRAWDRRILLAGLALGAMTGAVFPGRAARAAGGLSEIASRHRVTVVNFWASWCPPCVNEMPALEAVFRQMRGRGVGFVGVNDKQDPVTVSAFVRKRGVSYPIILDANGALSDAYGVHTLPVTLILDQGGAVRSRISEQISAGALRARIESVLRAA